MDNLILGLRPNELAAIVFGIVGMVFGLISYQRAGRSERMANESNARSIKNENQAREIAFARRRSEVLGFITSGKLAYMAVLRKLKAFQSAALEAGATQVGPTAESLMAAPNASIAKLTEIEKEIESAGTAGKSHEELMTLMSTYIDILKKSTDPALITEEFGRSFDEFERNIRLVTLHKEVAKQLGQSR
jgi:hypothetical protein